MYKTTTQPQKISLHFSSQRIGPLLKPPLLSICSHTVPLPNSNFLEFQIFILLSVLGFIHRERERERESQKVEGEVSKGGRGERMKIQCNVCEAAEAAVLCCADEAALCWACDKKIHAANKLASMHQRVPLSSSSSQMPKCDICQVCIYI